MYYLGFPGSSAGKESAHNEGDPGSIPGSGGSPGEGKGWLPAPVFLHGEFHGQRSWQAAVCEQLSLSLY